MSPKLSNKEIYELLEDARPFPLYKRGDLVRTTCEIYSFSSCQIIPEASILMFLGTEFRDRHFDLIFLRCEKLIKIKYYYTTSRAGQHYEKLDSDLNRTLKETER